MADFSANATQLSGVNTTATPVAPVQEQVVSFGIPKVISDVADIFAKGLIQNQKEEAQKTENAIVGSYIKSQTELNDAVQQGMNPAEAAARQRAAGNMYLAQYPQYAEAFLKANNSLKGITEKGEIEKAVETEQKRFDFDVQQAQQRGFSFPPGATRAQQQTIIDANKTMMRAEAEQDRMFKQNAEKRAQGTFDQGVADREAKDNALKLIVDVAGSNLDAFGAQGAALAAQVQSGKMSPMEAAAQNASNFARISAQIQAVASTNPELAAPYRSLFNDLNEVNKKLLDPANDAKALEDQKKILITRAQLMALQRDPATLGLVATSQMLPNNLALASNEQATKAFTLISESPVFATTTGAAPVVGNPEVEGPVLNLLKKGISDLKAGKFSKPEKAALEQENSVNNLLKQTGNMLALGEKDPAKLKGIAGFFASPEYATVVQSGKIDAEANQAAKRTFQVLYEPAVTKAIGDTLNRTVRNPVGKEVKVIDGVNVKFTGSGVVFEAKAPGPNAQAFANELKTAQQGLNQLIHIGAHMEGTTDYQKYWEDNKHILLPQAFPDPKLLKPGQVVNGFRWDGIGSWKNPDSYTKVN